MITVDSNIEEVQRALGSLASSMPKATAQALNDVAFKVMYAERAEMQRVFDRPKTWLMKNVRVFKAKPDRLAATVGATDWFNHGGMQEVSGGHTAWERILAPHVYGGTRLAKASESRLHQVGLLPRGWFTVPGAGAKRDKNGNISGGDLVAILSWVGAMGQYDGDNTNRADRLTRRRNATERRGQAFFVARVGNRQRLAPGIYKRFSRERRISPVLMFVSRANYRQRLDWFGVGRRVIDAEFPRAFVGAFGDQPGVGT